MKSSAHAVRNLDRAVEAGEVVLRLHNYGFTQASIAKATGATVRSVRNWQETSAIRPQNDERLRELREIVLLLRETLTPRGVGQSLTARNRILGGRRPIEVVAEGRADSVRDAA